MKNTAILIVTLIGIIFSAQAQTFDRNKEYVIEFMMKPNHFLTVCNTDSDYYRACLEKQVHSGSRDTWEIVPLRNGYFKLFNTKGTFLSLKDNDEKSGTDFITEGPLPNGYDESQQFRITQNADGSYYIMSRITIARKMKMAWENGVKVGNYTTMEKHTRWRIVDKENYTPMEEVYTGNVSSRAATPSASNPSAVVTPERHDPGRSVSVTVTSKEPKLLGYDVYVKMKKINPISTDDGISDQVIEPNGFLKAITNNHDMNTLTQGQFLSNTRRSNFNFKNEYLWYSYEDEMDELFVVRRTPTVRVNQIDNQSEEYFNFYFPLDQKATSRLIIYSDLMELDDSLLNVNQGKNNDFISREGKSYSIDELLEANEEGKTEFSHRVNNNDGIIIEFIYQIEIKERYPVKVQIAAPLLGN